MVAERDTPAPATPAARLSAILQTGSGVALAGKALSTLPVLVFAGSLGFGFEIAMTILAVAATLTLTAFLRSPPIGLLAVVCLCVLDVPLRVYVFTEYSLPYNSINYVLLAMGVVTIPTLLVARSAPGKWLAAFVVIILLQLLPSSNHTLGMLVVLEVVAGLALIGGFLQWGRDDEVIRWAGIVAGVTGASCLLAYLLNRPEQALNANAVAHVPLAAIVAIAVASARSGVIRNWALMMTLATINIVLVFLTESRGTFVLGVILGIYIVLRSPGVMHKFLVISLFAGMFAWATATFAQEFGATADKWARFMDPDVTISQATNRRVDLAAIGWDLFLEHPLGTGTGSFTDFQDYTFENLPTIRRAAHSAWVKTMAENGAPGLLLLAGFVLSFVMMRNRGDPRVGASFGALAALVLALGFVSVEFQSKGLWMLAGGATALLSRLRSGEGREAEAESHAPRLRASVLRRPERPGAWR